MARTYFCLYCQRYFPSHEVFQDHLFNGLMKGKCVAKGGYKKFSADGTEFSIITDYAPDIEKLEENQYALYKGSHVYKKLGGYIRPMGRFNPSSNSISWGMK